MTSSGVRCHHGIVMGTFDGMLFSGLIVILLVTLLGLRIRFSEASQRAETIMIGIVTVLFFAICGVFLGH
jgi:hypothetical protein